MNNETQPAADFEPIHDGHAIEQVQIAVNFHAPILDDAAFAASRKAVLQFHNNELFPAKADLRTLSISLVTGGSDPVMSPQSDGPQGLRLTRTSNAGVVEKEFRFERTSLTFRTTIYRGWADMWGEAKRYFEAVLSVVGSDVMLASVTLSFVDKFNHQDTPTFSAKSLLSTASKFVPPFVFELQDMFHCHTGAFLYPDAQTRRLLNVNIDSFANPAEDGVQRGVNISTIATDMFDQADLDPTKLPVHSAMPFVIDRMDLLHAYLKDVIGDVLSEPMSRRIGLKK